MLHPDDLTALARSRQEEALAWAERRRLIQLAAGGGAPESWGPGAAGTHADDLRRSVEHLGRLVRAVVLVTLLVVAAAAVSGVLTDAAAATGPAAAFSLS